MVTAVIIKTKWLVWKTYPMGMDQAKEDFQRQNQSNSFDRGFQDSEDAESCTRIGRMPDQSTE